MASISFVLKEPKGKLKTPIYLLFRFNNDRVKISTKELVHPEDWKKQKISADVFNHQEMNNKLNSLKQKSLEIYNSFKSEYNREPVKPKSTNGTKGLPHELKTLFDKELFSTEILIKLNQQKTFFEFFENLIEVRSANKKVSKQRIAIYKNTLKLLKGYQLKTKDLVSFERFNERFSINFIAYLEEEKNYSTNTIKKNFNVIRAVLNNAFAKNYNVNREYKLTDFMPESEESFEVSLSIDEVERLHKFDFSKNQKLERVRDLFVVACYTGLRFGDLQRLKKEHLQSKFLSVVQEKTKKKNPLPVIIPILEPVKEIFIKYDYNLPNEISNQKMNLYLKEMAEESKLFDDIVTYQKIKGGKKMTISQPRHKEIKTHSARRTFCTMSYLLGVPTQSIMKISGHRTEKSFLRYLKVSNDEHAERTLTIWEEYYLNNKKKTGKTIKMVNTA